MSTWLSIDYMTLVDCASNIISPVLRKGSQSEQATRKPGHRPVLPGGYRVAVPGVERHESSVYYWTGTLRLTAAP